VIELTIPPNTPKEDPQIETIKLPYGWIKEVMIYFPWGCAGMVHVTIWHDEHQVWPSNPDTSYSGNDILIEFPENYRLPEAWNRFSVRGWSPNTKYKHTPIIRLTVLEEEVPPWAKRLFGRLLRPRR